MPESRSAHPYDALTPDVMLDAVERFGVRCDGTFLALNSYENRVYQVGIEDAAPLVVKFYRPARWSREAIHEEHAYAHELAAHEIPVVAPLAGAEGDTLFEHEGFAYALYPREGGRAPELDAPGTREIIGRLLGRWHALGRIRAFAHRPSIDLQTYGHEPRRRLRECGLVPAHVEAAYWAILEEALERTARVFDVVGRYERIRLHGDCHVSNILWRDDHPHFVDLDDCRSGPAVQDLWMLLAGDRDERSAQLAELLSGYTEFCDFDAREIALIEALRTLRLVHYCAWLASRWDDPAFPVSFPWFNTPRYWEGQVETLQEQCANLEELPLVWEGWR